MSQKRNVDNKKKCKQQMAQKWLISIFRHPEFFKRTYVFHSVYALDYIHDIFIIQKWNNADKFEYLFQGTFKVHLGY